ncbi:MAG: hypothetical protein RJA51_1269, partial [Actinomycetota bacterium]
GTPASGMEELRREAITIRNTVVRAVPA